MSGYREGGFDPGAWTPQGPPMRPYNIVQWAGFILAMIGIGGILAYFAGRAGLIPKWIDSPVPFTSLCFIGTVLVNSRRQPIDEADLPALRAKQKRVTIIALAVAVIAAIVGFAVAYFKHPGL